MSLFFRCRYCGWTQPTVNPTESEFEKMLSCCPACEAEHPNYQDYLDAKDREETETYRNGDAVIAHDGGWSVTGVVSDVYDDVVDVDYFDTDTMSMETMDFHISQVEHA